jgi:cullin 3
MEFILESKKDGFTHLIENDRYKDLSRMFELFSFHNKHFEILKEKFKAYTTEVGTQYVTDQEKTSDPVLFFQSLFDLKEKYDTTVLNAFNGDESFQTSLNDAFQYCINGNVQTRLPEYLSLFLDSKIKKLKMFDKKAEQDLERGMVFFKYLEDNNKDVFETYYRIHLAKRLLTNRESEEDMAVMDAEQYFISKLSENKGNNYHLNKRN